MVCRLAHHRDVRRHLRIRCHLLLGRYRHRGSRGRNGAHCVRLPRRFTASTGPGCHRFGSAGVLRTCIERSTSDRRLSRVTRRQGAWVDPECLGDRLDWIVCLDCSGHLLHASIRNARPRGILVRHACWGIVAGHSARFRIDIRPHERNDTHRHDFGPSGYFGLRN